LWKHWLSKLEWKIQRASILVCNRQSWSEEVFTAMTKGKKELITLGIGRTWSRFNSEPDLQSVIIFSGTNRDSVSGVPTNHKERVQTFSQKWAARKNKQTPRNKPTQLAHHAFSHTNGLVRFLTWNKYKVREKSIPHESDEGGKKRKKTHRAVDLSFRPIKNGLTAEHFSVCCMREELMQSRHNIRNAHNYRSLRIQTLHWCMTYRNSVLWKSTASEKYNGRNFLAVARLLLRHSFPTTTNIVAALVLCDVSEIVEFQTFSFGRICFAESEKRHQMFLNVRNFIRHFSK
jgi:hypothetical protein